MLEVRKALDASRRREGDREGRVRVCVRARETRISRRGCFRFLMESDQFR